MPSALDGAQPHDDLANLTPQHTATPSALNVLVRIPRASQRLCGPHQSPPPSGCMLVWRQVSADASGLLVFNVLGTICFAELDLAPLLGKVTVNALCFGADLSFLTVSACREEANSRWAPIVAVLDTSVRLEPPSARFPRRPFGPVRSLRRHCFVIVRLRHQRCIIAQRLATQCNDLQHGATLRNTVQQLQRSATNCNAVQNCATPCNNLQRMQRLATRRSDMMPIEIAGRDAAWPTHLTFCAPSVERRIHPSAPFIASTPDAMARRRAGCGGWSFDSLFVCSL